jgi:hypothetical protein
LLTTTVSYRMIASDLTKSLDITANEPTVSLDTKYYLAHIGAVKSIDDLLKDTRLFKYAMTAFGLQDMATAKAFMRKVLTEGVSDPKSFANSLTDQRFVDFATTFNFAANGADATSFASAQQGVVDKYIRQTMETDAGADNQGVQLALYFQREAPSVKSAYGLLADPALWQVVKTTFGFPDAMANAPIEAQAAAVNAQLNIADLSDPAKLDKLLTRFTATWDATQVTAADPVLVLFDQSSAPTVDSSLIEALNTLRTGGP